MSGQSIVLQRAPSHASTVSCPARTLSACRCVSRSVSSLITISSCSACSSRGHLTYLCVEAGSGKEFKGWACMAAVMLARGLTVVQLLLLLPPMLRQLHVRSSSPTRADHGPHAPRLSIRALALTSMNCRRNSLPYLMIWPGGFLGCSGSGADCAKAWQRERADCDESNPWQISRRQAAGWTSH